jgi:hypothetical protein
MSEENVEVVRRFCERDDQTSLDSLMVSLHPDIEWVPVQSDPEYSVHRGHDDVRAWLTSWAESFLTCVGNSIASSMRGAIS